MPSYEFKVGPELVRFAAVAAVVYILQQAVTWNPAEVANWTEWAIALGTGAVQTVAAAVLAKATENG